MHFSECECINIPVSPIVKPDAQLLKFKAYLSVFCK